MSNDSRPRAGWVITWQGAKSTVNVPTVKDSPGPLLYDARGQPLERNKAIIGFRGDKP